MHVVMFGDQHLESLGGAQVSMRLQRRFLERAGHTVTVVAPVMHGARGRAAKADAAYLDLPSIPITLDREYSLAWPGARTDRFLDAAMADRPPVDLVHVQADFWGAFTGHRYAARHGLPVVHTMHNRVDVGIEATAPAAGLVLRALNSWQRRALHVPGRGRGGWDYLQRFARLSRAVTAPSSHFARRLEARGAVPLGSQPHVDVVWNGIDDDVLDAALAAGRGERRPGPARLVWIGRMSPEKRLLPFLEAVAASGAHVEVEVIGGGGQWREAQRTVARAVGAAASVRFVGRLTYLETLRRIAAADAVVQTSIGFETQGMTPFEGASLGTPAIVCDPDIANELGSGIWRVGDGVTPDASVEALAAAIQRAATDVANGSAPVPDADIGERFRQSSRTAAMIDIYRRVTATA